MTESRPVRARGMSMPTVSDAPATRRVSLVQAVCDSFLDPTYQLTAFWKIGPMRLIDAPQLYKSYEKKKQEMLLHGSYDDIQENFFFSCYRSDECINLIIQQGLVAQDHGFNFLGNSLEGVILCKHADVQLKSAQNESHPRCLLMIFKAVCGRICFVTPSSTVVLNPTLGFDCHMSSIRPTSNDNLHSQALMSQVYFYEPDSIVNGIIKYSHRPRQCLPIAYIEMISNVSLVHPGPNIAVDSDQLRQMTTTSNGGQFMSRSNNGQLMSHNLPVNPGVNMPPIGSEQFYQIGESTNMGQFIRPTNSHLYRFPSYVSKTTPTQVHQPYPLAETLPTTCLPVTNFTPQVQQQGFVSNVVENANSFQMSLNPRQQLLFVSKSLVHSIMEAFVKQMNSVRALVSIVVPTLNGPEGANAGSAVGLAFLELRQAFTALGPVLQRFYNYVQQVLFGNITNLPDISVLQYQMQLLKKCQAAMLYICKEFQEVVLNQSYLPMDKGTMLMELVRIRKNALLQCLRVLERLSSAHIEQSTEPLVRSPDNNFLNMQNTFTQQRQSIAFDASTTNMSPSLASLLAMYNNKNSQDSTSRELTGLHSVDQFERSMESQQQQQQRSAAVQSDNAEAGNLRAEQVIDYSNWSDDIQELPSSDSFNREYGLRIPIVIAPDDGVVDDMNTISVLQQQQPQHDAADSQPVLLTTFKHENSGCKQPKRNERQIIFIDADDVSFPLDNIFQEVVNTGCDDFIDEVVSNGNSDFLLNCCSDTAGKKTNATAFDLVKDLCSAAPRADDESVFVSVTSSYPVVTSSERCDKVSVQPVVSMESFDPGFNEKSLEQNVHLPGQVDSNTEQLPIGNIVQSFCCETLQTELDIDVTVKSSSSCDQQEVLHKGVENIGSLTLLTTKPKNSRASSLKQNHSHVFVKRLGIGGLKTKYLLAYFNRLSSYGSAVPKCRKQKVLTRDDDQQLKNIDICNERIVRRKMIRREADPKQDETEIDFVAVDSRNRNVTLEQHANSNNPLSTSDDSVFLNTGITAVNNKLCRRTNNIIGEIIFKPNNGQSQEDGLLTEFQNKFVLENEPDLVVAVDQEYLSLHNEIVSRSEEDVKSSKIIVPCKTEHVLDDNVMITGEPRPVGSTDDEIIAEVISRNTGNDEMCEEAGFLKIRIENVCSIPPEGFESITPIDSLVKNEYEINLKDVELMTDTSKIVDRCSSIVSVNGHDTEKRMNSELLTSDLAISKTSKILKQASQDDEDIDVGDTEYGPAAENSLGIELSTASSNHNTKKNYILPVVDLQFEDSDVEFNILYEKLSDDGTNDAGDTLYWKNSEEMSNEVQKFYSMGGDDYETEDVHSALNVMSLCVKTNAVKRRKQYGRKRRRPKRTKRLRVRKNLFNTISDSESELVEGRNHLVEDHDLVKINESATNNDGADGTTQDPICPEIVKDLVSPDADKDDSNNDECETQLIRRRRKGKKHVYCTYRRRIPKTNKKNALKLCEDENLSTTSLLEKLSSDSQLFSTEAIGSVDVKKKNDKTLKCAENKPSVMDDLVSVDATHVGVVTEIPSSETQAGTDGEELKKNSFPLKQKGKKRKRSTRFKQTKCMKRTTLTQRSRDVDYMDSEVYDNECDSESEVTPSFDIPENVLQLVVASTRLNNSMAVESSKISAREKVEALFKKFQFTKPNLTPRFSQSKKTRSNAQANICTTSITTEGRSMHDRLSPTTDVPDGITLSAAEDISFSGRAALSTIEVSILSVPFSLQDILNDNKFLETIKAAVKATESMTAESSQTANLQMQRSPNSCGISNCSNTQNQVSGKQAVSSSQSMLHTSNDASFAIFMSPNSFTNDSADSSISFSSRLDYNAQECSNNSTSNVIVFYKTDSSKCAGASIESQKHLDNQTEDDLSRSDCQLFFHSKTVIPLSVYLNRQGSSKCKKDVSSNTEPDKICSTSRSEPCIDKESSDNASAGDIVMVQGNNNAAVSNTSNSNDVVCTFEPVFYTGITTFKVHNPSSNMHPEVWVYPETWNTNPYGDNWNCSAPMMQISSRDPRLSRNKRLSEDTMSSLPSSADALRNDVRLNNDFSLKYHSENEASHGNTTPQGYIQTSSDPYRSGHNKFASDHKPSQTSSQGSLESKWKLWLIDGLPQKPAAPFARMILSDPLVNETPKDPRVRSLHDNNCVRRQLSRPDVVCRDVPLVIDTSGCSADEKTIFRKPLTHNQSTKASKEIVQSMETPEVEKQNLSSSTFDSALMGNFGSDASKTKPDVTDDIMKDLLVSLNSDDFESQINSKETGAICGLNKDRILGQRNYRSPKTSPVVEQWPTIPRNQTACLSDLSDHLHMNYKPNENLRRNPAEQINHRRSSLLQENDNKHRKSSLNFDSTKTISVLPPNRIEKETKSVIQESSHVAGIKKSNDEEQKKCRSVETVNVSSSKTKCNGMFNNSKLHDKAATSDENIKDAPGRTSVKSVCSKILTEEQLKNKECKSSVNIEVQSKTNTTSVDKTLQNEQYKKKENGAFDNEMQSKTNTTSVDKILQNKPSVDKVEQKKYKISIVKNVQNEIHEDKLHVKLHSQNSKEMHCKNDTRTVLKKDNAQTKASHIKIKRSRSRWDQPPSEHQNNTTLENKRRKTRWDQRPTSLENKATFDDLTTNVSGILETDIVGNADSLVKQYEMMMKSLGFPTSEEEHDEVSCKMPHSDILDEGTQVMTSSCTLEAGSEERLKNCGSNVLKDMDEDGGKLVIHLPEIEESGNYKSNSEKVLNIENGKRGKNYETNILSANLSMPDRWMEGASVNKISEEIKTDLTSMPTNCIFHPSTIPILSPNCSSYSSEKTNMQIRADILKSLQVRKCSLEDELKSEIRFPAEGDIEFKERKRDELLINDSLLRQMSNSLQETVVPSDDVDLSVIPMDISSDDSDWEKSIRQTTNIHRTTMITDGGFEGSKVGTALNFRNDKTTSSMAEVVLSCSNEMVEHNVPLLDNLPEEPLLEVAEYMFVSEAKETCNIVEEMSFLEESETERITEIVRAIPFSYTVIGDMKLCNLAKEFSLSNEVWEMCDMLEETCLLEATITCSPVNFMEDSVKGLSTVFNVDVLSHEPSLQTFEISVSPEVEDFINQKVHKAQTLETLRDIVVTEPHINFKQGKEDIVGKHSNLKKVVSKNKHVLESTETTINENERLSRTNTISCDQGEDQKVRDLKILKVCAADFFKNDLDDSVISSVSIIESKGDSNLLVTKPTLTNSSENFELKIKSKILSVKSELSNDTVQVAGKGLTNPNSKTDTSEVAMDKPPLRKSVFSRLGNRPQKIAEEWKNISCGWTEMSRNSDGPVMEEGSAVVKSYMKLFMKIPTDAIAGYKQVFKKELLTSEKKVVNSLLYLDPVDGMSEMQIKKMLCTKSTSLNVIKEIQLECDILILGKEISKTQESMEEIKNQLIEHPSPALDKTFDDQEQRYNYLLTKKDMYYQNLNELHRYQKSHFVHLLPEEFLLPVELGKHISVEGMLLFLQEPTISIRVCTHLASLKLEIQNADDVLSKAACASSIDDMKPVKIKLGWLHFERKRQLQEICCTTLQGLQKLRECYDDKLSWYRSLQAGINVQYDRHARVTKEFVNESIITLECYLNILKKVKQSSADDLWSLNHDRVIGCGELKRGSFVRRGARSRQRGNRRHEWEGSNISAFANNNNREDQETETYMTSPDRGSYRHDSNWQKRRKTFHNEEDRIYRSRAERLRSSKHVCRWQHEVPGDHSGQFSDRGYANRRHYEGVGYEDKFHDEYDDRDDNSPGQMFDEQQFYDVHNQKRSYQRFW